MARQTARARRAPAGAAGDGESGNGAPASRTQDQRGNTRRITDAKALEEDVETALDAAHSGQGDSVQEDVEGGEGAPDASADDIVALRRQLRSETRRREAAEHDRDAHAGKAAEALDAKTVADLNTLKTAKSDLERQQTELRRRLSSAHAEGDFDEVAVVNQEMTTAAVRLQSIDNGIVALEQQPQQRAALARRGEPADGKFQAITKGMDPAAKQWFRDNPEYYQDDRKLNRVIAAHNLVMSMDDPPEVNGEEYFDFVEKELGRFDPKFEAGTASARSSEPGDDDEGGGEEGGGPRGGALSDASQGERRRADRPAAAAPVTRNGRGAGGAPAHTRDVRLSKDELDAAEMSGLTPEEYQANKVALVKEQRVGPGARNRNQMH